ncbi:hypothetical protein KIPB_000014 [Kipferlia bialata]|uniref:Kelch-type beta propeller n=1 Tax=Kipferlia bialata TaxID=797122 RepID=A0A391NIR6_9EUKA|nr:hypothetical protein KIPB_000014 [Kipferlia bialata]|eukprot:g14.t1
MRVKWVPLRLRDADIEGGIVQTQPNQVMFLTLDETNLPSFTVTRLSNGKYKTSRGEERTCVDDLVVAAHVGEVCVLREMSLDDCNGDVCPMYMNILPVDTLKWSVSVLHNPPHPFAVRHSFTLSGCWYLMGYRLEDGKNVACIEVLDLSTRTWRDSSVFTVSGRYTAHSVWGDTVYLCNQTTQSIDTFTQSHGFQPLSPVPFKPGAHFWCTSIVAFERHLILLAAEVGERHEWSHLRVYCMCLVSGEWVYWGRHRTSSRRGTAPTELGIFPRFLGLSMGPSTLLVVMRTDSEEERLSQANTAELTFPPGDDVVSAAQWQIEG